jgi:hypothetical protein
MGVQYANFFGACFHLIGGDFYLFGGKFPFIWGQPISHFWGYHFSDMGEKKVGGTLIRTHF